MRNLVLDLRSMPNFESPTFKKIRPCFLALAGVIAMDKMLPLAHADPAAKPTPDIVLLQSDPSKSTKTPLYYIHSRPAYSYDQKIQLPEHLAKIAREAALKFPRGVAYSMPAKNKAKPDPRHGIRMPEGEIFLGKKIPQLPTVRSFRQRGWSAADFTMLIGPALGSAHSSADDELSAQQQSIFVACKYCEPKDGYTCLEAFSCSRVPVAPPKPPGAIDSWE